MAKQMAKTLKKKQEMQEVMQKQQIPSAGSSSFGSKQPLSSPMSNQSSNASGPPAAEDFPEESWEDDDDDDEGGEGEGSGFGDDRDAREEEEELGDWEADDSSSEKLTANILSGDNVPSSSNASNSPFNVANSASSATVGGGLRGLKDMAMMLQSDSKIMKQLETAEGGSLSEKLKKVAQFMDNKKSESGSSQRKGWNAANEPDAVAMFGSDANDGKSKNSLSKGDKGLKGNVRRAGGGGGVGSSSNGNIGANSYAMKSLTGGQSSEVLAETSANAGGAGGVSGSYKSSEELSELMKDLDEEEMEEALAAAEEEDDEDEDEVLNEMNQETPIQPQPDQPAHSQPQNDGQVPDTAAAQSAQPQQQQPPPIASGTPAPYQAVRDFDAFNFRENGKMDEQT